MRMFALSDPHLSFSSDKPMDVFGPHWAGHAERIAAAWRETVGPDDLVLVSGDISWAMKPDEAEADLAWLAALPGMKTLVRGNHDYWWQGVSKLRRRWAPMIFLQADAARVGEVALCGTRLWDLPGVNWRPWLIPASRLEETAVTRPKPPPAPDQSEQDAKILRRELERMDLALRALARVRAGARLSVCLLHYPPLDPGGRPTPASARLSAAGVDLCVFGHLHGADPARLGAIDFVADGVRYVCASADLLDFRPRLLHELG